ncbi:class I SAM-dependent methyltransferase [Acidipila sp. EB88]|uniref:class I SAM-dependent methyltransferase n=1 Tax=Acidipila sp. EB88 TaxID=2305226 RepID=UPI0013159895|nr:class I SAM-dependent methyltransferase [Acidipila sp. EB88]
MSTSASQLSADPVFDRCWWIYSLCRERLFADHTDTIASALQPLLGSRLNIQLLEVGCGPGFYSRRLAARFPAVQALGVDTSERLLCHARQQAQRAKLPNCCFRHGDAQHLGDFLDVADAAIASRLFLILLHVQREAVMQAVFRTLRPGGIFFIAEPISPLRTSLPLWLMRAADRIAGRPACLSVPVECAVLSGAELQTLAHGQPWGEVQLWRDRRYQYALCQKAL